MGSGKVLTRKNGRPEEIVKAFYGFLKEEVTGGNPYLSRDEQTLLQGHYPFMMDPGHYPTGLVASIYTRRHFHPVRAILGSKDPAVLDGGCGYGSDSFLFAALGARVIAVNISGEQSTIALKRKPYFEEAFGRPLDITFRISDLNHYVPENQNLSLTWLASVLGVIRNQDAFLSRLYQATQVGGKIMIVDYNLLNPLFLWEEWRRRRRGLRENTEFACHADFWGMVRRRGRLGARFFPQADGPSFDDVQFFTPATLSSLLKKTGFRFLSAAFSGFAHPLLFRGASACFESLLPRLPGLNHMGRAYLMTGVK